MSGVVLGVSDFIAYLNQTLEHAYPYVEVEGELSNFRVSKQKWVYFDLKDETGQLRCFSTIYALPGPLEDGMVVRTAGSPRVHPLYNFSFQVQSIALVGEGALRRAAELLQRKLEAEGLFATDRKRAVPRVPRRVALITAGQSAAYADFVKIARARWPAVKIDHYDVLVQGAYAPAQLARAVAAANAQVELPDIVVLVRGGGSAEDLAAFNDERVVRAVAASRVPTAAAIGHETDTSLVELAADLHASTPSNAAELLLPDQKAEARQLRHCRVVLDHALSGLVAARRERLTAAARLYAAALQAAYRRATEHAGHQRQLLAAYNPRRPLEQGYAVVRRGGCVVRRAAQLTLGDEIEVELTDGIVLSQVKQALLD